MNNILSALAGLLVGFLLTMISEIVKKVSKKKLVASKLFSESVLVLKDLLESEGRISLVSASEKIYADNSPSISKDKLTIFLDQLKEKMLSNGEETFDLIERLKTNKLLLEKNLYLIEIIEDKYKKDTLLISREEISLLSTRIQPLVTEMIENYFYLFVHYKFLLLRIKNDEKPEKYIDELIEIYKYSIKFYKDRSTILNYSKNIANKSLMRSVLTEFKF